MNINSLRKLTEGDILSAAEENVVRDTVKALDVGPDSNKDSAGSATAPAPKPTPEFYRVMDAVITELKDDYLICKRINGDGDPIGEEFAVAKPRKLRFDKDEYEEEPDDIEPKDNNTNVALVTFDNYEETWRVLQPYKTDEIISITRTVESEVETEDTVEDPAEDIYWIDLNIDARKWQKDKNIYILSECFGPGIIYAANKSLEEVVGKVIKVEDVCYSVAKPTKEQLEDCEEATCVVFDPNTTFNDCCECLEVQTVELENCEDQSTEIFNLVAPGLEVNKTIIFEGVCYKVISIASVSECEAPSAILEAYDIIDGDCNLCQSQEVVEVTKCGTSETEIWRLVNYETRPAVGKVLKVGDVCWEITAHTEAGPDDFEDLLQSAEDLDDCCECEEHTVYTIQECGGGIRRRVTSTVELQQGRVYQISSDCYTVVLIEEVDGCDLPSEEVTSAGLKPRGCCECEERQVVVITECGESTEITYDLKGDAPPSGVISIGSTCYTVVRTETVDLCDLIPAMPSYVQRDNCNDDFCGDPPPEGVCEGLSCDGANVSFGPDEETAIANAVSDAGVRGINICDCTEIGGVYYVCWFYCCPQGTKRVTTYRYECENGDLIEVEDETFCVEDLDACDEECP